MKHPNRPQYEKEWREKNALKVKEQRKKYYQKNKEQIKSKTHKYYHEVYGPFVKKNYNKFFKEKYRTRNQSRLAARRKLLIELRQELGGKCIKCNFNKEPRILQFHHHNKDKKDNVTTLQSLEAIKIEARKCVLLCPNCHALEHLKS